MFSTLKYNLPLELKFSDYERFGFEFLKRQKLKN